MLFGLPIATVCLVIAWSVLTKVVSGPRCGRCRAAVSSSASNSATRPGEPGEWTALAVFVPAALSWILLPPRRPAAPAVTCASMLPVAIPPNAIVFGVTIGQMVRCGVWLNAVALVPITLAACTLGAWGAEPADRGRAPATSPYPGAVPRQAGGKLDPVAAGAGEWPPGGAAVERGRFAGFGEYAIDFFDGLAADNSRSYWQDNVETYRRDIRAPMEALLAELLPEFGRDFGEGRVFRPYRDVRFSHDKSPYKTHCGAVIEKGRGGGAYYVEIGPSGLRVGGGCFHLAPDQLARYRQAVDTEPHGTALEDIIATLRRRGWQVRGDVLKTRPRGVSADHPRLSLLRHRSLYVMRGWEPDDSLHERSCLNRVRNAWRQVREFNEWARAHVGTSERPGR